VCAVTIADRFAGDNLLQAGPVLCVLIGAADTGAWTALIQIAADALGCPMEAIRLDR
jgi:hypothetical protein